MIQHISWGFSISCARHGCVIKAGREEQARCLVPCSRFAIRLMADRRHARRVVAVATRAMAAPAASFPRMMRDDGELEGAYRLFSNRDVSPDSILDAHYRATAGRVQATDVLTIVVHDTSDCCFGGESERDGIGRVANKGKGLSVHVALALGPDGAPHGLLDLATHTRMGPAADRRLRKTKPHAERESARWRKTVDRAMNRLGEGPKQVVHVMDREADDYLLWEALLGAGRAFVIRLAQNRRLSEEDMSTSTSDRRDRRPRDA